MLEKLVSAQMATKDSNGKYALTDTFTLAGLKAAYSPAPVEEKPAIAGEFVAVPSGSTSKPYLKLADVKTWVILSIQKTLNTDLKDDKLGIITLNAMLDKLAPAADTPLATIKARFCITGYELKDTDLTDAAAVYTAYIEIFPVIIEAKKVVLTPKADSVKATEFYNKGLEKFNATPPDYKGAINFYKQAIQYSSKEAVYGLAYAYLKVEQPTKALEQINNYEKFKINNENTATLKRQRQIEAEIKAANYVAPTSAAVSPAASAEINTGKYAQLMSNGDKAFYSKPYGYAKSDYSDARAIYQQAELQDSAAPYPKYKIGLTFMKEKDYAQAITFFNSAIKNDKGSTIPDARLQRSDAYMRLGQYANAVTSYNAYIYCCPKTQIKPMTLYNRALAYSKLDNVPETTLTTLIGSLNGLFMANTSELHLATQLKKLLTERKNELVARNKPAVQVIQVAQNDDTAEE